MQSRSHSLHVNVVTRRGLLPTYKQSVCLIAIVDVCIVVGYQQSPDRSTLLRYYGANNRRIQLVRKLPKTL